MDSKKQGNEFQFRRRNYRERWRKFKFTHTGHTALDSLKKKTKKQKSTEQFRNGKAQQTVPVGSVRFVLNEGDISVQTGIF